LRRVSQRPGWTYSRAKQVPAVAAGIGHTARNLYQASLAEGSAAAKAAAEPPAQREEKRQPTARRPAPGTLRRRQANHASAANRPMVARYGQSIAIELGLLSTPVSDYTTLSGRGQVR
jgi:hypothetical protein